LETIGLNSELLKFTQLENVFYRKEKGEQKCAGDFQFITTLLSYCSIIVVVQAISGIVLHG